MDWLIQWRGVGGADVQIVQDAGKAGSGLLTVVIPDMATARRDLVARGLELDDDVQGDFVAQIDDPDHNRITLTEPPHGM